MRMVYKIGNIADLSKVDSADEEAISILSYYAAALSTNYGEDRNIDDDDGGYILYCPKGTTNAEIKAYFDYTKYSLELLDVITSLCAAHYVLNNDYVVTIILSADDIPEEMIKNIKGD